MSSQTERRDIDFEKAKGLSLSDFMSQELGVPGRKVGASIRYSSCPSCGASKDPNSHKMAVRLDDRNWRCYSCGERGSILDAAMALWGCTVLEAHDRLLGLESFVRRAPPKVDRAQEQAAAARKMAAQREVFTAIQNLAQGFHDEEMPLRYLVDERKIPLPIVREAQRRGMLGFLPGDPMDAGHVLMDCVGERLLRECDLIKPGKKLPGIAFRPIVFFIPGMTSAEFRVATQEVREGQSKSIRYGTAEFPYWWQGSDKQCMIVEGMIDMLSAVALGFKGHIMGLTGCNTFRESWFDGAREAHEIKRFVIALDNDLEKAEKNPGQKWAQRIKSVLASKSIPCYVETPEDGDINDILKRKIESGWKYGE